MGSGLGLFQSKRVQFFITKTTNILKPLSLQSAFISCISIFDTRYTVGSLYTVLFTRCLHYIRMMKDSCKGFESPPLRIKLSFHPVVTPVISDLSLIPNCLPTSSRTLFLLLLLSTQATIFTNVGLPIPPSTLCHFQEFH